MSDFMRPAARAAIWRWREVIAAVAVAAFGVWWLQVFYSPVGWLGWAFVALGVGLTIAGVQRALFRQGADGPGVVQVRERRLAYFGPLTGGVMDVDDMTRLELEPAARPAAHWVLTGIGGDRLEIPVNAEGAEALFDIFAALPGIKTEKMLTVLRHTPDARVTVWSKVRPLLH